MSDLIGRIKKRIYEEQEKEFINNEVAMGDVECSKVIDIIDEESAKEPQSSVSDLISRKKLLEVIENMTPLEVFDIKYLSKNMIKDYINNQPQVNQIEQFSGYELAQIASMQMKLQHYKDLAEQGRLVELPCKVGDAVYSVASDCGGDTLDCRCQECQHCVDFYMFVEENKFDLYMISEIGKSVFLTKSEAEQALAERKE